MKASRSLMSVTGYSSTPSSRPTILVQEAGSDHRKRTTDSWSKSGATTSRHQSPMRHLFPVEISKHSSSASKVFTNNTVGERHHRPLKTSRQEVEIPDPIVRTSNKAYSPVLAYAISTHHGLYRLVNEDKVSVVLSNRCMFGLFDGYGGSMASEHLKATLLETLMKHPAKKSVETTFQEVFAAVEDDLITLQTRQKDKSGSSAMVCFIQNQVLYVANVGTSVAFGRHSTTGKLVRLANAHDCNNLAEYARIAAGGGRFYRTKVTLKSSAKTYVEGPLRIYPHGLTVTRTIGNVEAKAQNRIQGHKLVLSTPEIKYMKVEELQWIILCSQGLLEAVAEKEIEAIGEQTAKEFEKSSEHLFAEKCVQRIIMLALKNKCAQNATAIMIVLKSHTGPSHSSPPQEIQPPLMKKSSLRYVGNSPSVRQQS